MDCICVICHSIEYYTSTTLIYTANYMYRNSMTNEIIINVYCVHEYSLYTISAVIFDDFPPEFCCLRFKI